MLNSRSARSPTAPRALLWVLSATVCLWTNPLQAAPTTVPVDYGQPKLLVGNILTKDASSKKLLFRSERTASRAGSTVNVQCDYVYPDGGLAARDRIVYEGGELLSFHEEELQTGDKGSAVIRADARHPGKRKIYFEYTTGPSDNPQKTSDTEELAKDTLVDDMIGPFIASHWDILEKGSAAKFRFIVLSRKETVGFKLVKQSEATCQGKPAVRIKMEPTSIIIAQLVDPLFFVVEKQAPHRILEYIGRTTPLLKDGNKWKDLDAVSVFDWGQD